MRRRDLLKSIAGISATWPLAARAQQCEPMRHIAVLMGGVESGDIEGQAEVAAFEDGLKQAGWNIGGNIEVVYHWPGAVLDRVRDAAKEIVDARPDLVVSRSTPATSVIINKGLPVVFVLVADPVGSGFIQSLVKPGGNITGFAVFETSVGGKWFELLKEAAPTVSRVALLFNPTTAPYADGYLRSAQAAAQKLGASVIPAPCRSTADIEAAFAARAREDAGGIIIINDTYLAEHRDVVIRLAARYLLPAIYPAPIWVPSGGLMAYAVDYLDILRRAANYVDLILKGAAITDLPVQLPTRFTLMLNLKTAKALGLTIPQTLQVAADEVIE